CRGARGGRAVLRAPGLNAPPCRRSPSQCSRREDMRRALLLLVMLAACPAPRQYAVERSGLTCDRATRVARRTLLELGYTVTALVPAAPGHPGEITGTKTASDSTTATG